METETLTLPSDPSKWIKVRRRANYRIWQDVQALEAATALAGPDLPEDRIAAVARTTSRTLETYLLGMVVEWNLTDENGGILPINQASVDELDPRDGQFMAEAAYERAQMRGEQDDIPFGNSSTPTLAASQ